MLFRSDQEGPLCGHEIRLHTEGIVAVGAVPVELGEQLVMGQLIGILPLSLQGLEVELPFDRQLLRRQNRTAHHGEQQGQQVRGISGGALEAQHQGILMGFGPQAGTGAFHQIGEGLGIKLAAASGQAAGQELMGATTGAGIGAAATGDRQPGGEHGGS